MRTNLCAALLAVSALWGGAAAAAEVPMTLEGGRPYIDVDFTGPDGQKVHAHAWVDTGGGALILTQKLADALGLVPKDGGFKAEGQNLASIPVPELDIAGSAVKLTDPRAFEVLGNAAGLQGTDAAAAIPGRLLRGYDVVFDYPAGKFSLAPSGGAHQGTPIAVHIGDAGMPTVTVEVDGKPYGLLLDTGGTAMMLSEQVLAVWRNAHPDWTWFEGAYGRGDMLLGKSETHAFMLDVQKLEWGPFPLSHVIAVSRPAGTYEKNMSQLTGADIVGSLGGNVFQAFRMDIDYPQTKLYLTPGKGVKPAALDMVGVMLEPSQAGGYEVAMLRGDAGGLAVGDRLLKVGALDATQATFQSIIAALSGKPGESRSLTVQRGAKTLSLQVPVRHLMGAGS